MIRFEQSCKQYLIRSKSISKPLISVAPITKSREVCVEQCQCRPQLNKVLSIISAEYCKRLEVKNGRTLHKNIECNGYVVMDFDDTWTGFLYWILMPGANWITTKRFESQWLNLVKDVCIEQMARVEQLGRSRKLYQLLLCMLFLRQ